MKIKIIPQWMVKLGLLPSDLCVAIAPYIYLNKAAFDNYKNESLIWFDEAIIAHESMHVQRQKEKGLLSWLFLYFFSNSFCFNEEKEALNAEMQIYKKYGKEFNTENKAKFLSSFWLYHKCTTYEKAKEDLDRLWSAYK